jgi:hypothetical protein
MLKEEIPNYNKASSVPLKALKIENTPSSCSSQKFSSSEKVIPYSPVGFLDQCK